MSNASRQVKAAKRERAAFELKEKGIDFEFKNYGAHLIVQNRVDFWPGTGLWIIRDSGVKFRGLDNLLAWLENNDTNNLNKPKSTENSEIITRLTNLELRVAQLERRLPKPSGILPKEI